MRTHVAQGHAFRQGILHQLRSYLRQDDLAAMGDAPEAGASVHHRTIVIVFP